jgi:hypothetical protein
VSELPEIVQGYSDALVEIENAGNRLGCLAAKVVQEKLQSIEKYIQGQVRELMKPYDSQVVFFEYIKAVAKLGLRNREELREYEMR